MTGWVKLHRELTQHDSWLKEPFTRGQAWVDLILLANHKSGSITVRGIRLKVERGQVGWSMLALSKRWKWSEGKVKRFFLTLEEDNQIRVEKMNQIRPENDGQNRGRGKPVTSLITIVNYDKLQGAADRTADKRRIDSGQTATNKKVKNEKKKDTSSDFDRFWKAYPKKQGKQPALKAWQGLNPDLELQATIMTALDTHKACEQWQQENGRYVPLPATWLNQRRWEDEHEDQSPRTTQPTFNGMRVF